jgi:hypothetical protein
METDQDVMALQLFGGDNRSRTTTASPRQQQQLQERTIQWSLDDSWIEGPMDVLREMQEFFLDVWEFLKQPIMDPVSLRNFSVGLLLVDLFLSFLLNMTTDMLIFVTTTTMTTTGESSSSDRLQTFSTLSMEDPSRFALIQVIHTFLDGIFGISMSNDHHNSDDTQVKNDVNAMLFLHDRVTPSSSSVMLGQMIVVAMIVSCIANSCYFTTLMTPIYSRMLWTQHELRTEVLICMLLVLFCLESLIALSFFVLGCTALASSSSTTTTTTAATTTMQATSAYDDPTGNSYGSTTSIPTTSNVSHNDSLNHILILCTILWSFCITLSNVIRMTLYNVIGD